MSDAVARVLDLFRQSAEVGVTGVTHVTKSKVTARSSRVTPVTPATCLIRSSPEGYVAGRAEGQFEAFDVDERAAIAIHDGGIPDGYGEAFARLQTAQPIGVDHSRWLQLIDDAGRFLDQWGAEAERLQWTADELFKKPTMIRAALEYCGLCRAIKGRNVVQIEPSSVTLSDGLVWERPNLNVLAAIQAPSQNSESSKN